MKIDGLKEVATVPVDLSEFFDAPLIVQVRVMHPYGAAQVRELGMKGVEIKSFEAVEGKRPNVSALPVAEGSADRAIAMRHLKLRFGVHSTTPITSGGSPVKWDKELWDALDETNPKILDRVIEVIDEVNGQDGSGQGEGDPT